MLDIAIRTVFSSFIVAPHLTNIRIICIFSSRLTGAAGRGRRALPPPEMSTNSTSSFDSLDANSFTLIAVPRASSSGRLFFAPSQTSKRPLSCTVPLNFSTVPQGTLSIPDTRCAPRIASTSAAMP
uniref:Protein tprxl takahashii n=1 Tax=Lutzomyia longipalpis TaxID=7200 RepID=A0A7G3AQ92_LUTLO